MTITYAVLATPAKVAGEQTERHPRNASVGPLAVQRGTSGDKLLQGESQLSQFSRTELAEAVSAAFALTGGQVYQLRVFGSRGLINSNGANAAFRELELADGTRVVSYASIGRQ